VMSMEKTMENMVERITRLEVEVAEIKVKVDALWQRDLSNVKPTRNVDTTRVKGPNNGHSLL